MRKLINDGWEYAKLPLGSSLEDTASVDFRPVDVPHDWLIWQDNDLYESADAWYRRRIDLPEDHDPVVMICFDGVYMDCDVLLNGEVLCSHPCGYTAFDVPLTGKLNTGYNELMVHIRHQSPNSRWYSGSGIYRDVYLVTLPENYIIPDSLCLTENEHNGVWTLNVSAETAGNGNRLFQCALYDREGRRIAQQDAEIKGNKADTVLQITEARTWSVEDPYLYRLEMRYGKQTEVRNIGLRSVLAEPETGLKLNGRPVKLKGVCLHHDLGCLGAAFHEKAARRQLELMKNMGANAVRTSHNPPASRFLDLCDEMGILVIDEAFDMWKRSKTPYDYARFFDEWAMKDVASWVRRDRCHPSVIMWSVGNEIYDMHAGEDGAETTKMLAEQVRIHDPGRHALVTFGCNYMPWAGGQKCAGFVDAVGYNYGERLYPEHHRLHPEWIIYGSETGSVLSSRGIYHFPVEQSIMSEADRQCSALGNSNTSWGAESIRSIIKNDLQTSYSLGQFLWSGIDYIGEPTPYHTRSCYFGQADTACFPKDSYYLIQSYWSERKMIHIGVSWDWNKAQIIDIPVISNCPQVELLLNGQSYGIRKNNPFSSDRFPVMWKIPFSPGRLTARGFDHDGTLICEDQRFTPGETEYLTLSCENDHLLSDGHDIIFVTVSAEDAGHHPVQNDRSRVIISVQGGGRLIGTDNGDSTDTDSYKSDCRRLFSGKLLMVIASNGKKENVHIRIKGENERSTELTIPVYNTDIMPGITCLQEVRRQDVVPSVSARKVNIEAVESPRLTPDHPECVFTYSVVPHGSCEKNIIWQVTNSAGIESPYIKIRQEGRRIMVRAFGDGSYFLRALYMEQGECSFISQLEFSAEGIGDPSVNPYGYVQAGLYNIHKGNIGTGNEKGVAFARGESSMIGFTRLDFGKAGSDTLTADIFALNDDPYDIELLAAGSERDALRRITVLHYEKPSIWNVYQPETWKLPERLTGIQTLCFRMHDKVHMRGFVFEKQEFAYLRHLAGSADSIYGDCFRRTGERIEEIGNNVTLTWNGMDFGGEKEVFLDMEGDTSLENNTVHIRIRNDKGEQALSIAEFRGGEHVQRFRLPVLPGECSVSFVFLPGSSFDFDAFCFSRTENWTDREE